MQKQIITHSTVKYDCCMNVRLLIKISSIKMQDKNSGSATPDYFHFIFRTLLKNELVRPSQADI